MAMIEESQKRQLRHVISQAGRGRATQLMFRALEEGDKPTINFLLGELVKEGKLRINARSRATGDTLLHAAVANGHSSPCRCCLTIIRRLVRAGCRINSADSTGDTALHLAVRFHSIHLAVDLIKMGANVRARNKDGETPLQLAVANKSHVDVLKIIPNGDRFNENFYGFASLRLATAADWRPRYWIRALVASYEGKTIYSDELRGLVKMLLDDGADVNARDANGCSPLQCAVYAGDLELVQALVDAGADLNNRNDEGIAVLHDAVLCGNEAMVHLLLSHGAEVNVQTDVNDTALHWALQFNAAADNSHKGSHKGIIRRLVEFGSDLDHRGVDDETPLQLLLQLGDVDLLTFVVDEHKADLNKLHLHSDRSNPLLLAALNRNERVIDFVLQRSAGLEIDHRCGDRGVTPLHYASAMSLLGNVCQLIFRGADVNAKDSKNQTPLFRCVHNHEEGRRPVMILLLERGADVNIIASSWEENKPPATVLELAIFKKDIEAWKVIIEHAVKVEARTNQPFFDKHNLRAIEENAEVDSYYRQCRVELAAMRTTKIEGSFVSYLSVLTQKLDVVARYTRNDELVKDIQLSLKYNAYPIYASQLKEKFDAAIARRNRIDRAFSVLSETLQFADLTDLILENIFKYLNEQDVEVLIA